MYKLQLLILFSVVILQLYLAKADEFSELFPNDSTIESTSPTPPSSSLQTQVPQHLTISERKEFPKCQKDGRDGECVPYSLCKNFTKIKKHGQGVIDIRFDADTKCEHYLDTCCLPTDRLPADRLPASENSAATEAPNINSADAAPNVNKYSKCRKEDRDGECVPFWLCSNSSTIKEHGEGVIRERFGDDIDCKDISLQCCFLADRLSSVSHSGNAGDTGDTDNSKSSESSKVARNGGGCGYKNTDGVGFRIKGANDIESEYGEFPWMAAILGEEKVLKQTLNFYKCGGSLIHPQVVLTGAHCIYNKAITQLKVRLGEWDTQTVREAYPHFDITIAKTIIHENFDPESLANNIGLLILTNSAPAAENIATVCLPPQGTVFNDKLRCTASGWGKDNFEKEGQYQVILKKVDLPVVPFSQCQSALKQTRLGDDFELHESFMCAGGEPGKDTCRGDGGSPLVCPTQQNESRYYQAGIVSWGIGCGETGTPGVYADVAKFRTWIDLKMCQEGFGSSSYTM